MWNSSASGNIDFLWIVFHSSDELKHPTTSLILPFNLKVNVCRISNGERP